MEADKQTMKMHGKNVIRGSPAYHPLIAQFGLRQIRILLSDFDAITLLVPSIVAVEVVWNHFLKPIFTRNWHAVTHKFF